MVRRALSSCAPNTMYVSAKVYTVVYQYVKTKTTYLAKNVRTKCILRAKYMYQ